MSQSICFGLHYLNHNDVRSLLLYSVFLISPHMYSQVLFFHGVSIVCWLLSSFSPSLRLCILMLLQETFFLLLFFLIIIRCDGMPLQLWQILFLHGLCILTLLSWPFAGFTSHLKPCALWRRSTVLVWDCMISSEMFT